MTPSETLKATKEKIREEKHFTQKGYARDEKGIVVWPWDPAACCWCVSGALQFILGRKDSTDFTYSSDKSKIYLGKAAIRLFGEPSFLNVNDKEGFEATHKMLDCAIEMAERDEVEA